MGDNGRVGHVGHIGFNLLDGSDDYVAPKEEPEPTFTATDGDSGNGGSGNNFARICSVDDYYNPPKEEPELKLNCSDINADGDYGPLKENPESKCVDIYYHPLKEEPELATTDGDGGDSSASDDYPNKISVDGYYLPKEEPEPEICGGDKDTLDANSYCDYGLSEDDPESKFIDVYYHPLKVEPEAELGGDDGDVVVGDSYYDCDRPKEEPELHATDDDAVADGRQNVVYDCSHCGANLCTHKFKTEHELRYKAQMQRTESESQVTKLYRCGYCKRPFVNKEDKEQHQRRWCRDKLDRAKKHSKGTYFQCDKCKFSTKWKLSLKRHVSTHNKNNVEWFSCTQCLYKTVYEQCMTVHMKIHDDTLSRCCPICGEKFRRKPSVDNNLLRQHFNESDIVSKLITSNILTCNICNECRNTSMTNFNKHVAINHPEGVLCQCPEAEWIACTQCSYKTVRKSNMTKHMKIHDNNFSCCCPICRNSFKSKRALDDHILKQHSDEAYDVSKLITSRIHTCNICNQYRSTLKSNFNKHVALNHLRDVECQKYECPRCPYSTFYKYSLKAHSKTHLEQKDCQCTVCKKQFTEKQGLDSHILTTHAGNVDLVKTITSKIHHCESCSFKTVKTTLLKRHLRSRHL